MAESPQGRRVLVALVTGDAGDQIQEWRLRHDPQQARRIPPHATLCYWIPDVTMAALDTQVRHAFPEPIPLRLGHVQEFDNVDRTFFIEVRETGQLDEARERLFDGTVVELPGRDRHWTWHVTCVRKSIGRNVAELREAAQALVLETGWTLDTIACLELRGDRYEEVARWELGAPVPAGART
jgi:hypothetical protein